MSDDGKKIGPSQFKARMIVERPDDIEMTLKMTMTIKEWERLRDQLDTSFPSWMLTSAINEMLSVARKTFYPSEPTP